jgi:AAA ATPase domain/Adenylate and Guanylate cyclase catalytic domain
LTDVEGSTRRWEADPDHMAELLEAHDATIEAEVAKAGGELIKARGEGDSTFAVFPDPPAAVQAAVACQVRLISEVGLPVRMAIHTGETHQRWGDYYGPPVNRAARLRSLATGGRVLVSASTADCVRAQLPAGCHLVDLGVFVLRDLDRPERIFGVHHPALPEVLSPRHSVLGPDLVGRRRELATLRALLSEAERSQTRIAIIRGEGGIGKTRLAEVVGREACASGGRLLWATAHGDVAASPFSIWTDLGKRLPDGGPGLPEPFRHGSEEPDRENLYDRIVVGIRGAAETGLLMVVLDDLHQADPSSLQLLGRMASERDLGRLLLLAIARPTPGDHPAAPVLTQLGRVHHATTIDLGDLSADESSRLLLGHAPDLDAHVVTEVLRHAGGNPLFLRAYATTATRPGASAMPETVRTAIAERLATVEPDAARVIEMAAVAGRSIAVDITAAAVGVDEGVVLRSLAAGETAGLISQASVMLPSWRFTHDIIRDAIVAGVDPAERAAAHGRIGRALERLRAAQLADYAAEIATHFSHSTADNWPSAVSYGEEAARAALRAGAFEQAAGHCQRALDQLARMGGDTRQRARLLIMLGSALTADDTDAGGNAILDAIGIARSIGDQELLIRAIETLPPDSGRLDARAVAELRAVLEQLAGPQPAIAARLHGHLAFHHFTTRRWEDLQREADAAWRLSRGIGDPATRFFGSLGRLLTLWCDPDRQTSRLVLDECTWAAEACADPSIRIRGRYMRLRPIIEFADRDGFSSTIELVEESVSGYVATYSQWVAATWRTLEATLEGDFDQADELLQRSEQLGQGRSVIARAAQFHQRSMLRFEQGRLAEETEAIRFIEAAWPGHPVVLGWLALAVAEAGDRRGARAVLATLDDDGFDAIPAQLCFALAPLTEAAVRLGEPDVAARIGRALAPRAGHLLVGFGIASDCYGAVDRYLGLSAALACDHDTALDHHAAAARLHRRFRTRLWLLHGQVDTAAALAGRGQGEDVARARALAEEVVAQVAGTPLVRVRKRATDLLDQLP